MKAYLVSLPQLKPMSRPLYRLLPNRKAAEATGHYATPVTLPEHKQDLLDFINRLLCPAPGTKEAGDRHA